MKWIRFAIVLGVATILNTGNLMNFVALPGLNVRPDLLLILLVFFVVHCDWNEAIVVSFLTGLAADISGTAMGPYMIVYGIFGFLLGQMRKVVVMQHFLHQALTILVAGILTHAVAELLILFKTGEMTGNFWVVVFGTSGYSAVAGPILWALLHGMLSFFGLGRRQYAKY